MHCIMCRTFIYDTMLAPIPFTDPKFSFMRLTPAKLGILMPSLYHLLELTETREWYPTIMDEIESEVQYIMEQMMDIGFISLKAGENWGTYNMEWLNQKLDCIHRSLSLIHYEHTIARFSRSDGYIPEFDACYTTTSSQTSSHV